MARREVFNYPGFRNLWIATGIGAIGTRMFEIAFVWLLFEFTTDPTTFAVALAAVAIPEIFSTLAAGIVADRFNRIRTIIASQLARAALLPLVPLFAADSLPALIAIGFLIGVAGSFEGPARGAVVPNLLPDDDLDEGNTILQILTVSSRILYVFSGAMVMTLGAPTVILLSAFPLTVSAFVLLWVPDSLTVPQRADDDDDLSLGQSIADFKDVFDLFRSDPVLRSLLVLQVAHLFVIAPIGSVILPVFTTTAFGGDSFTYGVIYGSFFAGMFFSAGFFNDVMDRDLVHGELIVLGTSLGGVFLVAMAVAPLVFPLPFIATVVFYAMSGMVTFYAVVAIQTLLQLIPSDADRGKVFSVLGLLAVMITPVSFLITGPLVSQFGPIPVLAGVGVLSSIIGVSLIFTPLYTADADETKAGDAGDSYVPTL